jgi:hypothetical protein
MNNWKAKLGQLKGNLPPKDAPLTPERRKPTRREVIDGKIPVYYRVNDRVIRKSYKSV